MSEPTPIEVLSLPGNQTAKIFIDDIPTSPREWDNLGTMVCFHRRYSLGDTHRFADPLALREFMDDPQNGVVIRIPLYLYDHSGLTMGMDNTIYPFTDRWDAGQVGFVILTREKLLHEYNAKRLTQAIIAQATEVLEAEVREYDKYLRGEVYRYETEDADGNVVDSCCGYFDLDYLKEELNHATAAELCTAG